jgi:TPR repeat protein
MYEFGEGVPLNLRRAQKLYQQAARQDLREARTSLALLKGKMLKVEQYIRNHHKPYYGKDKQE